MFGWLIDLVVQWLQFSSLVLGLHLVTHFGQQNVVETWVSLSLKTLLFSSATVWTSQVEGGR